MVLSISGKKWKFPPEIELGEDLIEVAGGSELVATLMYQRGIKTAESAREFLFPKNYSPSSPMDFAEMPEAIRRISKAIAEGEKITVYGDYDVDGVTGTSVITSVLKKLGGNVDYYIPNRTQEGYGLNLQAVSVLASKHRTKLIITCDCGISNFAEVNFARSFGVDTIICDHHTIPELVPPAVATLHPKQLDPEHPLYDLPGVGVAYMLCRALLEDRGQGEMADELLDLVTLGMIADLVPLVRENRYLVQVGFKRLLESARPGIRALLSQVGVTGGTDLVGFGIAPRINAVGRLSDANEAVELMTTENPEEADKIARRLQTENSRRQELCEKIMEEADSKVARKVDLSKNKAIVIYDANWHHGVVGIVASRLVEKYHVPVFIGELSSDEGVMKGSARGVPGIDLFKVLQENEHLMTRWGGHKMAAGFSMEAGKAELFADQITATVNKMLQGGDLTPELEIDVVTDSDAVTMGLVKEIEKLEPFGMGNRKPVLVLEGLTTTGTRLLGKEGKHARIMLGDARTGKSFEAVLWNSTGRIPAENQNIDIAFSPEINSYKGRDRLQLVLKDWRDPAASSTPFRAEMKKEAERPESTERVSEPAGASGPVKAGLSAKSNAPELRSQVWKDLRNYSPAEEVLETAARRLGERLGIFAETGDFSPGYEVFDRTEIGVKTHLMLWQFPPGLPVLKQLLNVPALSHVYLVGASTPDPEDGKQFLRRLYGLVKFAFNKRDGRVVGEKLAAALAASKMSVALGLTVLRSMNLVDWFAEDGYVFVDVLDSKPGRPEDSAEFRQLEKSLEESRQFRSWLATASIKEIQLAVMPNSVSLPGQLSATSDRCGDETGAYRERPPMPDPSP